MLSASSKPEIPMRLLHHAVTKSATDSRSISCTKLLPRLKTSGILCFRTFAIGAQEPKFIKNLGS